MLVLCSHIKGSFEEETFIDAFDKAVLPNVYEGVGVVIDNARTHDMHLLSTRVRQRGGHLINLPCVHPAHSDILVLLDASVCPRPYSPDLNPIELAFGRVKGWLRSHHHWVVNSEPRCFTHSCTHTALSHFEPPQSGEVANVSSCSCIANAYSQACIG